MSYPLAHNLSHSRAAYRYALASLPPPPGGPWPMHINGFTFGKVSEVFSMQEEYGWAFFCRYEACVEAFLKDSKVHLKRDLSLKQWLDRHGVKIPSEFTNDLEIYRDYRNRLHHEDGAALDGDPTKEIELPPPRMEDFYNLFVWIGDVVAQTLAAGA